MADKFPVITIIHGPKVTPIVNVEQSIFCPTENLYLMGPNDPDLLTFFRTIYAAEKDRSEWIRKYQNVLNGLNYWKNRALENEKS